MGLAGRGARGRGVAVDAGRGLVRSASIRASRSRRRVVRRDRRVWNITPKGVGMRAGRPCTGTLAAAMVFFRLSMKPAKRVKRVSAAFMGLLEHERRGVGKC